ncbi:uncharacterized protein LOC128214438 [Mya arenaria]|nr:uncharacterized protein LOC128214434 [Mya arenaria]XP_052776866.1 uncharacterized protein LOC128214435 [Mya arenaria]XP_052776867.1 uncharacterized protein LOC128214436 [Mya arenaria]XP_052776868.1 uncharacterized protein LOC128214437 [Mya arenaria]XP_052776869.1 uncharacterized protein LOC128214438 [Mya arenaria]
MFAPPLLRLSNMADELLKRLCTVIEVLILVVLIAMLCIVWTKPDCRHTDSDSEECLFAYDGAEKQEQIQTETIIKVDSTEPSCPKYNLEKRLIERVIKNEVEIKHLHDDISTVREEIGEMTRRINQLDLASGFRFEQLSQSLIENMTRSLAELETARDMVTEMTRLKGASIWPPKIQFTANSPFDKYLDNGQTIVLKNVVINDGQGYDPNTGIFTCPFSGLYTFSFQHCVHRGKYSHVGIVKDNTLLIAGVAFGTEWYPCSSMQAFVSLKKGEKVWSKANWESFLFHSETRWTSLSGVLLRSES